MQGRPLHEKPPSGPLSPPLRYQARFPGLLGSCPWNWTLIPPPRGLLIYPWPTLANSSPTPAEAECQGRTGDLEPGWGASHGTVLGGVGPGERDPHPWTGSPVGSQACTLPARLIVSVWPKLSHPAPSHLEGHSFYHNPPKSSNTLLWEGIGGPLPLVSAEGFQLW